MALITEAVSEARPSTPFKDKNEKNKPADHIRSRVAVLIPN